MSPPYFIPVPPNLSPIGGLGAFIRLRSPVYDRRQLLDVGAAGPLAGFVVAIGVLLWGYQLSHPNRAPWRGGLLIHFSSPASRCFSAIRFSATCCGSGWCQGRVPCFSPRRPLRDGWPLHHRLNLLPLSQLDGGHVAYGLAGKRQTWIAIAVAAGLVYLGTRGAPMWYLWAALTFAIGGGK